MEIFTVMENWCRKLRDVSECTRHKVQGKTKLSRCTSRRNKLASIPSLTLFIKENVVWLHISVKQKTDRYVMLVVEPKRQVLTFKGGQYL